MSSLSAVALGIVVAVGAASGAWWLLGRSSDPVPIESDDVTKPAPADVKPTTPDSSASAQPASPTGAPVADDFAWDAVARKDEALPVRPTSERPPAVPISKDYAREPMITGEALIKAIVASRLAPVRWDSAETRDRFARSRFRFAPRGMPDRSIGILLIEVPAFVAVDEKFSARLDEKALWIGARGVY